MGDEIEGIAGRNASFSGGTRVAARAVPRFPTIVGVDWTFTPKLGTTYNWPAGGAGGRVQ
jgi:hypothetical protein